MSRLQPNPDTEVDVDDASETADISILVSDDDDVDDDVEIVDSVIEIDWAIKLNFYTT